jgi:hypothetical protein
MDEIHFTRCAVAFLDILGFKRFIEAAERAESPEFSQLCELQHVIDRQLDCIQTSRGEVGQEHRFPRDVGLQIVHVSDSFVLSAPICNQPCTGYSGMVAVALKSIQLAHQLLRMGFLIRGGLAVGSLCRTESNIFGTAYQAAYETERCATAPRVLFHQSAVEHFEADCHLGIPLGGLSIFAQEGNEVILDSLAVHWSYVADTPGADVSQTLAQTFISHKTTIERQLAELRSGRAREKWEWMAKYFNAKLRHSSELASVGAIEIDKYSLFRFGPLIAQSASTFEEAFGPFMAPPLMKTEGSQRAEDYGSVADGE